jgi:hypothetical protein
MLTPMLPTVVSSCLDVLWVVDHSGFTRVTVGHEKPSSVAVLDILKPVHLASTPISRSKAFKKKNIAHSPSEWHTYTTHVSIVSMIQNLSLTCLLPFIYTGCRGFNK